MEITKDYLLQKRADLARHGEAFKAKLGSVIGAIAAIDAILVDLEAPETPIDIAPPVDEPQYGADAGY